MTTNFDALFERIFAEYERRALAAFDAVNAVEAAEAVEAVAKADGSAVTRLDLATDADITRQLKEATPAYGIISEEASEPTLPGAQWRWVMDPVDGTASFVRGYPTWGLGVGLTRHGEPVLGYLAFPALRERYSSDGSRILRNGRPARLQEPAVMPDLRNILVGSTSHREVSLAALSGYKLRNFGASLFHLLCLALGRAELMLADQCKVWDLAPGLPFTRARGFVERYVDGSPFSHPELMDARARGYRIEQPLLIGPAAIVDEVLGLIA